LPEKVDVTDANLGKRRRKNRVGWWKKKKTLQYISPQKVGSCEGKGGNVFFGGFQPAGEKRARERFFHEQVQQAASQ